MLFPRLVGPYRLDAGPAFNENVFASFADNPKNGRPTAEPPRGPNRLGQRLTKYTVRQIIKEAGHR